MKSGFLVVLALLLFTLTLPAQSDAEEAARDTSNLLTITTYGTSNEGHLITFPDSTTMSIDCASGTISAKSHFHADHCASCGDVGQYHRNNVVPGQYLYNKDGVTVQVVAANVSVIGQEAAYVECPASDENKVSMGLLVRYGGFDYLTAGDLTTSVEKPLGAALVNRGVNVDVLKVSHHGSKTSSSLLYLQQILPEYAVICGSGSSPYEETLSNLTGAGVQIIYYARDYPLGDGYPVYRANGDVVITTDGRTFTFSGGNPPFSHGAKPVDDKVSPTPSCPTPTPLSPGLCATLNKSDYRSGDALTVDVSFWEVPLDWDGYLLFRGPTGVHSVVASGLRRGVHPIVRNAMEMHQQFTARALSMQIPYGVGGSYECICAIIPAGYAPTEENARGPLGQMGVTPFRVQR